jgi:hypothetical protein
VNAKLPSFVIPGGRHAIKIRANAKFWRPWHGNKSRYDGSAIGARKSAIAGMLFKTGKGARSILAAPRKHSAARCRLTRSVQCKDLPK